MNYYVKVPQVVTISKILFSTYSDDRISSKFKNMIEKIDNIRVFEHPPIFCEDAVDELFQPTQMTLASRNECKDI